MYPHKVILFLSMLLACATEVALEVQEPVASEPEEASVELPLLKVEGPHRAMFDTSPGGVISGQVASGSAPISAVTVNGQTVQTGNDGSFSKSVDWTPGIQIIGVRVEDEDGERAVDGRAIQAGPVNGPGQWVEGGLRLEIDTQILDDDDDEIDDIAALLEAALEDPSLAELVVGESIEMSGFEFTPTRVSFAEASVDLVAGEGVVQAEVTLQELEVAFDVTGSGVFSWVSTSGAATIGEAEIGTEVAIFNEGGRIQTRPSWVEADLIDLAISVDWIPSIVEESFSGWIEAFVEDAVVEVASTVLEDVVANSLQAFVIQMDLGEDIEMEAALREVDLVPGAVRFVVDTRLEARTTMEIPVNAGSLSTDGEPPAWPISNGAALAAAVDDDFINQLSFAFWHTGQLKDVSLPGIAIAGMSGSAIPAPLGPAENVVMTLGLPPVATAPRDDSFNADLSIGEWTMRFERVDGEVLEFSVNLRTALNASIEEAGSLTVELDDRPSAIELEIGTLQSPEGLDPGDLAALVRLLVPPLIGNSAELVPNIPIPTIPMGELVDIPAAEGLEIGVVEPEMEFSEAGWLLLRADLAVQ